VYGKESGCYFCCLVGFLMAVFRNAVSAYESRHQYLQCFIYFFSPKKIRVLSEGIYAGALHSLHTIVSILCIFVRYGTICNHEEELNGELFLVIFKSTCTHVDRMLVKSLVSGTESIPSSFFATYYWVDFSR
jgi:hypothetical protein